MRLKILILCLGCTLAGLLLQTWLFQSSSSKIIYNQAKEESYRSMQYMQNDIRLFLKGIENGLIDIYNEKSFINDLKNECDEKSLKEKYYRMAYNLATENFENTSGIVALYIYDREHQNVSTYRRAVTPKHNYPVDIYDAGYDVNEKRVRDYFDSENTQMYISSYYNPYRKTDIVRFVLKIYNYININSKIGYIVCDVDSKVIEKIVEKYRVDENMVIWLQPSGDRPIYASKTDTASENSDYQEMSQKIWEETLVEDNLEYENKVFFSIAQDKYNLTAYSLVPSTILTQTQKLLTTNLILITVIMLCVISISIYYVSRVLSRPIEEMTKTVKRIRQGETHLRMENLKRDEVGELGESFNSMLDQIESLIKNEYEYKLQVNKAMYHALQAQINPHFLYNTLDTMSSIAEIQDCYEVSAMCQSLAGIFRYSLDMKKPLSTVSQEIVHLKNYIFVMNTRMMNQIKYEFDIEENLLQDTLPRISIQPLVENSISHGVKNKKGEKIIRISVKKENNDMVIMVEDNGVGMDEEKIRQLYTDELYKEKDNSDSIGLANIHQRMRLLYGEEYKIIIQSKLNQGTMIQLRIPRKRKEPETLWG